jgi:hypothetical protein
MRGSALKLAGTADDTRPVAVADSTRRKHKRIAKRISALINADGTYGQGHIKNLSKLGLFVRSRLMPEPGTPVEIRFETFEGGKVEVSGIVRWTTAGLGRDDVAPGFGVRIEGPSDEYVEFFASLARPSNV